MRDSFRADTHRASNHQGAIVILLHGIGRSYRSMRPIEKTLTKAGYAVVNIDYPSRKKDIETIAREIYQDIHHFNDKIGTTLHFVTHSMGGLVVRQLLSQYTFPQLGRVIMLAPPNQGSEIADFLKNNLLFKLYYGPAGQELTTYTAKSKPFPLPEIELGIIAGNSCLDPFCYFLLPGKHDGKVTVESTKLLGMKDHIELKASHTFIMRNKNVIDQVIYFLANGKFQRPDGS